MITTLEQTIWDELHEIPDPEIPTINLVDLGIIHKIKVGEHILVEMMPTFVGCPALDMMRRDIKQKLAHHGKPVNVKVVFDEVWTTERISAAGRKMLLAAGLAPPSRNNLIDVTVRRKPVSLECPLCHSANVQMENMFGPTPCRAICYCNDCHQPFEQFKAV